MKKEVALALSGGGARGIAHIGVIEELEGRGYKIVSVSGTSMGSMVGGFYAMGKLQAFKEFVLTIDKRKTFQLMDFSVGSQGLIKGEKLMNTLKEHLGDEKIENFNIPFAAVATDVVNKKEVVFTEGSIYEAIRASIAIPSVLTPVKSKNGLLVDGGVMNNIPLSILKHSGKELLIAVDVNANVPVVELEKTVQEVEKNDSVYKQKIKLFNDQIRRYLPKGLSERMGYLNLIESTISLMMHHMSQMHIQQYSPDMLINISRDSCSAFDFFKAADLIELGRLAAKINLDEFEK